MYEFLQVYLCHASFWSRFSYQRFIVPWTHLFGENNGVCLKIFFINNIKSVTTKSKRIPEYIQLAFRLIISPLLVAFHLYFLLFLFYCHNPFVIFVLYFVTFGSLFAFISKRFMFDLLLIVNILCLSSFVFVMWDISIIYEAKYIFKAYIFMYQTEQ